jgi:serine protease SohB
MELLTNYAIFLIKIITVVVAILALVAGILALIGRNKEKSKGRLEIKKLNNVYQDMQETLNAEILSKADLKNHAKRAKKQAKQSKLTSRKRVFVLQFEGDLKASAVAALREEVSALLSVATRADEIVLCLESAGGMVTNYGLAASQLERIRQQKIPLTVIIDKVAASGGYLMACVGNRILAAPFAMIGSIGVVAQIPNFHRLLQKNQIDFEQITAGEYKRTLSLFGENTEKARKKMQQEVEEIHHLFKSFVLQNRQGLDLEKIATGEYWPGRLALELNLVDELVTSDDYLLQASKLADIYQITYRLRKSLSEKLSAAMHMVFDRVISRDQHFM